MALLCTGAPRFRFRWRRLPRQDCASPRVPHEAPQHHSAYSKSRLHLIIFSLKQEDVKLDDQRVENGQHVI